MQSKNDFPQFYKQREDNRFMKRIDERSYIMVQVIGYQSGSFSHIHMKSTFPTEEHMISELDNWQPCTEDEYESMMACFFSYSRRDGKLFSKYRQKKWQQQNSLTDENH